MRAKYKVIDEYYKNKKTGHLNWAYRHSKHRKQFISISHSDNDVVDEKGKHSLIALHNNPDPNDSRPAYAIDEVYESSDDDFNSRHKNYFTSKQNKKIYYGIIRRHKK